MTITIEWADVFYILPAALIFGPPLVMGLASLMGADIHGKYKGPNRW